MCLHPERHLLCKEAPLHMHVVLSTDDVLQCRPPALLSKAALLRLRCLPSLQSPLCLGPHRLMPRPQVRQADPAL